MRPFNLFVSYDNSGFEAAVAHCTKAEREECLSFEQVSKLLKQFIADGIHDWMTGGVESFEIYDEEGKLFFQFAPAMKAAA